MSLFASILFNVVLACRPLAELPIIWIGTVYKNFAMALLWNLFFASPATQACFGFLFKPAHRSTAAPAGVPR